ISPDSAIHGAQKKVDAPVLDCGKQPSRELGVWEFSKRGREVHRLARRATAHCGAGLFAFFAKGFSQIGNRRNEIRRVGCKSKKLDLSGAVRGQNLEQPKILALAFELSDDRGQ